MGRLCLSESPQARQAQSELQKRPIHTELTTSHCIQGQYSAQVSFLRTMIILLRVLTFPFNHSVPVTGLDLLVEFSELEGHRLSVTSFTDIIPNR